MIAVRATRAVVPAAGRATRLMPLTRVVPKALMPVAGRPALHYLLDELVAAEVDEVCVLTRPGDALPAHFSSPAALETDCPAEAVRELRRFDQRLTLRFVDGDAANPAWSLAGVREFVGEEPFVLALPDEIVPCGDGLLVDMIDAAAALRASVVAIRGADLDVPRLVRIDGPIAKPADAAGTSAPMLLGRYVLRGGILDRLADFEDFFDLLSAEALDEAVVGLRHEGSHWDIGTVASYMRSFVELAS